MLLILLALVFIAGLLYLRHTMHWWSWQNLNEKGSGFYEGRAWVHWEERSLSIEWLFGKRSWSNCIAITKDCRDGYKLVFSLGIWRLFHIWLTIGGLKGLLKYDSKNHYDNIHRTLSFSTHDGLIDIDLWVNPNAMKSNGRREILINWKELLFGYRKYDSANHTEWQGATLSMPEGEYPLQYRNYDAIWKYKRFRRPKRVARTEIKFLTEVWFAGKGDNDWDMEDDCFDEITVSQKLDSKGVAAYAYKAVMEKRRDYGLPETEMGKEAIEANRRVLEAYWGH